MSSADLMLSFQDLTARQWWLAPLVILCVTLATYANSFPGAFILDDLLIVVQNPMVNAPDLITIFTSDYWHGYENSGLYRPLTILSLAANRLLTGPGPLGFHLINVLLHAGVAVSLWHMLRTWQLSEWGALTASLLFAVHPLHTQVVNEVVGRSELQVALFLLAGFCVAHRRGAWPDVWIGACFLFALLSKEHAITYLALLPLWEACHARNIRVWRESWRRYAVLLVISAGWLVWRKAGVSNPLPEAMVTVAAAPLAHVDGATRVLTALHHQWLYLAKLIWPYGLQTVYAPTDLPPFIESPFSLRGLLVLSASLVGVALLGWGVWRRSQVALCFLLYLVAFLPTSNLLFAIGVSFAERLTYFPSIWFCAGIGLLAAKGCEQRRWQGLVLASCAAYMLLLAWMTLWRNPDYVSGTALWEAEVLQNPRDYLGWESLANRYLAAGKVAGADRAYQRMLAIEPDYPGGLRARSAFFLVQRRYREALPTAERAFALSRAKGDRVGLAFDGLDLAEAYLGMGECQRALDYLDGPVAPLRNARALGIRAAVLGCLGRDTDAVSLLREMDDRVMTAGHRYQLGLSLMRLGRFGEARQQLALSVEIEERALGWNVLGVACAQQGDLRAAVSAFARAVELEPDNAEYLGNLQRAEREAAQP